MIVNSFVRLRTKPVLTLLGSTVIVHGRGPSTVNELLQVTPNVPNPAPVTVTSLVHGCAVHATDIFTLTSVALVAVTLLTVMPVQPKLTFRFSIAVRSGVFSSLMLTSVVLPTGTDIGLTLSQLGANISNASEQTSQRAPLIPTPTSHLANCASSAIVILATTSVADLAYALFTVILGQLNKTSEDSSKHS